MIFWTLSFAIRADCTCSGLDLNSINDMESLLHKLRQSERNSDKSRLQDF
jgi:hypothetical protein